MSASDEVQPAPTAEPAQSESHAWAPSWDSSSIYDKGDAVFYDGYVFEAMRWTQSDTPDTGSSYGVWRNPQKLDEDCNELAENADCDGLATSQHVS